MSATPDDELQREIERTIEHLDDEALQAIYACLAPVDLSLSREQEAALRNYAEPLTLGEPQFFSWEEIKAAIACASDGHH